MEWLTAALTIGGLVAVLYGLAIAWPPLALVVGGTIALRSSGVIGQNRILGKNSVIQSFLMRRGIA